MGNLDNVRLDIVRPDDHVLLSVRFRNVDAVKKGGQFRLERAQGGLLFVEFPPQSFAEQAFVDQEDAFEPAPPGRVRIRISRPSRLVFQVPPELGPIPFSVEGILAACGLAKLATAHRASGPLFPQEPGNDHTVLEVPYAVRLSPSRSAGWAHTAEPAEREAASGATGRSFALWHTRLGVRREVDGEVVVDERDPAAAGSKGDEGRTVRAAWPPTSPDDEKGSATPPKKSPPFLTAFSHGGRKQLFEATSDKRQPPIAIDRLMLSSLGAWLDARWDRASSTTGLLAWRHHMTQGRDHAVRVVDVGWLYPYGHLAERTDVSERRIGADGAAYIHIRQRLQVLERERSFADDLGMPFRAVRITTSATPVLADTTSEKSSVDGSAAFWPMLSDEDDFLFDLEVEDRAGVTLRFRSPLVFVSSAANIPTVRDRYEADPRRVVALDGRRVVYVPASHGSEDAAAFDTAGIAVTGLPTPAAEPAPPFRPRLLQAKVTVPALRQLTGKEHVGFSYHGAYVAQQGANAASLFAVLDATMDRRVAFSPELSGGMVAPDMAVTGLSTVFGPVGGGPHDIDEGKFDAATFFGDAAPRLFGVVSLVEILAPVRIGTGTTSLKNPFSEEQEVVPLIPRLVVETPTCSRLQWGTDQLRRATTEPAARFKPVAGTTLWLDVVRDVATNVSTTKVAVGPFAIDLAILDVEFRKFTFHAETGKKTDVSVQLGALTFKEPLTFVNELQKLIDPVGFEDPPALDVTADGITASYSLQVPDLSFGIFNLRGLAVGAHAHLPLVSNGGSVMGLGFQVGERHNPFMVGVSYFSGMGFFGVAVDLQGVVMLEASLEFGGALALSIGVASGAVTLTAGFYYANSASAADAFAGFVRCTGALEVLGLISISAQFYLEMLFVPGSKPATIRGTATMMVKVEVLFFSESVELTVTREFSRSPAPTFASLIPDPDLWRSYCDAFAEE